MEFKKPKDVETLIQIWGWMDDIITNTKSKKAVNYWKRNGIPKEKRGPFYMQLTPKGPSYRVTYDAIAMNRYWWKEAFEKCDYQRMYEAFVKALTL